LNGSKYTHADTHPIHVHSLSGTHTHTHTVRLKREIDFKAELGGHE